MSREQESLREEALAAFLKDGGAEKNFAFTCRERRDGTLVPVVIDLGFFRSLDDEELEEELEDMQNDLDDTVDAIDAFEEAFGNPVFYREERLEDYETLLDERFAVEFSIAQVMQFL